MGFTRPSLTYATQQLSQFVQKLRTSRQKIVVHVLRYIKGTPLLVFFFLVTNSLKLEVYYDAY